MGHAESKPVMICPGVNPWADWLRFHDPKFDLQFQYPGLSSDGEPVDQVGT